MTSSFCRSYISVDLTAHLLECVADKDLKLSRKEYDENGNVLMNENATILPWLI